MELHIEGPYEPRPVRPLGVWTFGEWRMKAYGIAHGRPAPRPELVAATRRATGELLAAVGAGVRHYHAGFVGVHEGKTASYVFVDWWADENELHHHLFAAPLGSEELEEITSSGILGCAWDLRLLCFERDAWVRSVLQRHPEPDLEAYLAARLDAEV